MFSSPARATTTLSSTCRGLDALNSAASECTSAQVVAAIRAIQETTAMLESNVNPRLCIEGMMLRMPQIEFRHSELQQPGP